MVEYIELSDGDIDAFGVEAISNEYSVSRYSYKTNSSVLPSYLLIVGIGLYPYDWCSGRNKSWTTFTGENVEIGTSTNMVFQLAIAPFQRPGSS